MVCQPLANNVILSINNEDIDMKTKKSRIALSVMLAILGTTAGADEFAHNGEWNRHDT
jgi:hypothetical protein